MEEQNIVLEFFHEHPLRQITNVAAEAGQNWCYGCLRYFLPREAVYGCSVNCGNFFCLHEECAEMAREIRHPLHPSHRLKLQKFIGWKRTRCSICDYRFHYSEFAYICGQGGCAFRIHLACAGDGVEVDEDIMEHPQHKLRHLRGKKRSSTFCCDACGLIKKDNSYICTKCDYWIHESCASLPTNKLFHHHPHSLSLVFYPPYEYINNEYTCDICDGALRLKHWIYHCALCRYVVHVNCATASNTIDDESGGDDQEEDILKAPMHDMYEEMIRPFVLKERGEISFPHDNQVITTYKYHKQDHPLRFTTFSSSSSSRDDKEEGDSTSSDDDVDDVEKLKCDGCALAIDEKSGYMSCGECKYFVHMACFNLPPHLPSHPLHQIINHKLSLRSADKLSHWAACDICKLDTNGLFYSCTECSFKIDIKCASLPNIITHAAHPQHRHFLKSEVTYLGKCEACYEIIHRDKIYNCDKCRFSVCCKCVLLSGSNEHRLEKHTMPLTYDATVNRPGDFYCSNCEEQMNPKSWMYHCRECDQSFHPKCFPAASGEYRNINFGRQEYHVSLHPHHSLRFQIISKKKRCNVCRVDAYDKPGFQCTSCNFAMCFGKHKEDVKLIE